MNANTGALNRGWASTGSILGASACLLLMAFAIGCGDGPNNTTGAGGQGATGGTGGAGGNGGAGGGTGGAGGGMGGAGGAGGGMGGAGGAGGGMGGGSQEAKLIPVPASEAGHDRLFGVTFDPQGNIYATGVVASSTAADADFATVVVKFLPTGALDETFGTKGIATHNVSVGTNGEVTRGIIVQSTGKIVVAGTVEHAGAQDVRDRDISVLRFNADGTLDKTFGTEGVVILDLSPGELVGQTYVADTQWGLNVYKDDSLLVIGAQKAPGRTDTDFAVVKLSAAGTVDKTFGTDGVTLLDINMQGATPKGATILDDGSAVVSGYTRDADNIVSPVLFKVDAKGQFDKSFGANGVFNQIILTSVAEAYDVAMQGKNFVTAGYGTNGLPGESLDWLSLRVTANGMLDSTYATKGAARIDMAGNNDNGRALTVLPDNRIVIVGGGRPAADNADAMVAILTPEGQPDKTFDPAGWKSWDLGGGSDFFWDVALSTDGKLIAAVGTKGVGMAAGNDDGALWLMPVGN